MATITEVQVQYSFDEKKEDPPSVEARPGPSPGPGPSLSPSKRRAKAAGSAGLSELSKQLRILQAQNEAQSVDINRLERQLRILAELQGISVADLRKALEDACANEAFGEMQHRVAKLRLELEAATLAKRAELRKDAAAPHIANLELRVGELEEVEEKQQAEIHHLYEELRHERARATRLESEGEQHKKDAQDYLERWKKEQARAARLEANFQEQLQTLRDEQARKLQEAAEQHAKANSNSNSNNDNSQASSSAASISPEMAAEYERMMQLLKQKEQELRQLQAMLKAEQDKCQQQMKETDGQARQAQMNMKVDQDKMALTIKELQDADSQSELRLAQFKARFAVQDERIQDMEQQLNSLYTAFELLKEDIDAEDTKRAALACNLNEADAEIARQVNDMEKRKSQGGLGLGAYAEEGTMSPRKSPSSQQAGVPRMISTPTTVASSPGMTSPSPASTNPGLSFSTSTPTARAVDTPVATTRAYASPQRTPTTWQLILPENRSSNRSFTSSIAPPFSHTNGAQISGTLLVKSNSMVRKWKPKHSRLFLQGNHYRLELGDTKSFMIGFGISTVEYYANHPLSFVIHTNPFDPDAHVIHAAAINEEDYHRWMAALTKATSGGDYQGVDAQVMPPRRLEATPGSPRTTSGYLRGFSSNESQTSGISAEDQEAADLERALAISKTQL
jgi:ABC-type transporter Mla MlaB component